MKEDDIIAQIETDKVTIDVKYQQPGSGVLKELLIKVILGSCVVLSITEGNLFKLEPFPRFLKTVLCATAITCLPNSFLLHVVTGGGCGQCGHGICRGRCRSGTSR